MCTSFRAPARSLTDNILTTLLALSRIETARPSHKMLWILSLCAFCSIALIHKPQRASLYHIFTDLTAAPPRPITTSSAARERRAKSRQSWSRVSRAKIETSRSTTTRGKLFINEIVTLHKLEIICEVGNQMRAIFSREFKSSRSKKSSLETNRVVKSLREMCFNYFYSTEPIDFMVEWKIAGELAIGARLLRTAKRKLENCKIIFFSSSLYRTIRKLFVFI